MTNTRVALKYMDIYILISLHIYIDDCTNTYACICIYIVVLGGFFLLARFVSLIPTLVIPNIFGIVCIWEVVQVIGGVCSSIVLT